MKGIFPFFKPKGITSYDVIRFFKKFIPPKEKIGHGGTLDPNASGVLVIGIGKEFTKKLSEILKNSVKVYEAEIELGSISNTGDTLGEIKKFSSFQPPLKTIKNVLKNFQGEIYQIPPIYSAKKINGIPAYKLARKNKNVLLAPQKVFIKEIKIIKYEYPILVLEINCGSGTYIRSLAEDIGKKLKTGAYLKNLIRKKIDNFIIEKSITMEDIEKNFIQLDIEIEGLVQGIGFRYFIEKEALKRKLNGWCKNEKDNKVLISVQGEKEKLIDFLESIKKGHPLAKIEKINFVFVHPIELYYGFEIRF